MYQVLLGIRAEKQRRAIPSGTRSRVDRHLESLAQNPRPRGAVKLAGVEEGWRVRVGSYRILYTISDAQRVVYVYRVGHRREVYR